MSRSGDYSDEEDFPNQWAFWETNYKRALNGRRGRRALAELREALLMLPEKRLVAGAVSTAALKAKYEGEPDEYPGESITAFRRNWAKRDAMQKVEEEGIGVCAIGAYLVRKRVLELGETAEEAMLAIPSAADVEDCFLGDTAALGEQAGLTRILAASLADMNDETFRSCTPEQRYERFLGWLDAELASV